jgi:hypothetical protein
MMDKIYNLSEKENINISLSTNATIINHNILEAMNSKYERNSLLDISWHTIEHPNILDKVIRF